MSTSLADHLRALPDEALRALLHDRPDLAVPVPADFSALATRSQSRLSVARALEGLDQFTLEIIDALRLAPTLPEPDGDQGAGHAEGGTAGTSLAAVLALLPDGVPVDLVHAAVDRLRQLALVHGPDTALHVLATVADLCPPYLAGLGRPAAELDGAAAALVADPAAVRKILVEASPEAQAVLDRLAAGPPVGTVRDARRPATPEDADTPVRWLLAHRLLVPIGDDTVELPREIGLLLRRDNGPLGELHPYPPIVEPPLRDPAAADSAGAGQALETVRLVEALLEALGADPAGVLRGGGLGIRELRRLARTVDVAESTAALLLEIAYAAELLDDNGEAVPEWLPTHGYDRWRAAPLAERWLLLVETWLRMQRQPGLVGQRIDRDKLINALSPDGSRQSAPGLRRATLSQIADLPLGSTVRVEDVVALLAWYAPRRGGRARDDTARWTLEEAAALGLTGLGAFTSFGRMLLDGARDEAIARLDALLPPPVDHLLLQADLTAVVPGPPEPTLAAELALVAEPESAGAAAVFRITPATVRNALDAGMSADDLHGLFLRRSRTPVPQALTYLVNDVARRHGGLRAGTCGAYLRSDDEALLSELVADRRLSGLGLRRIAPTVVLSPLGMHRLLDTLRDTGYAPMPEDGSGAVVLHRPDVRRSVARTGVRPPADDSSALDDVRSPDRLAAAVASIRRGDSAARAARRAPVTTTSTRPSSSQALGVLQQAVQGRQQVWVGYVDAHGSTAARLVRPISIGAGYLRAEDERTETLHTFALHRITSAQLAD